MRVPLIEQFVAKQQPPGQPFDPARLQYLVKTTYHPCKLSPPSRRSLGVELAPNLCQYITHFMKKFFESHALVIHSSIIGSKLGTGESGCPGWRLLEDVNGSAVEGDGSERWSGSEATTPRSVAAAFDNTLDGGSPARWN